MEAVIPAGVALVGVFVAWKVLKGLIKLTAIVGIVAVAAYLYAGGVA